MKAAFLALCSLAMAVPAWADWPAGKKAAVVLTYDDALTSQLDHAVPVLDQSGLKATFLLSNIRRAEVERWRSVARKGHELANHTVFHACPAKQYPADPRYTTEAYTPASMLAEIEQENVLLTAIDGKSIHGFGTPCGNGLAGGRDYLALLWAKGLVSYIRTGDAEARDAATSAAEIDLTHIPARSFPEAATGQQLIDHARAAQAGGGLAVFVFHGVAGEYLNVSDKAHRELIAWLAAHRREI
jgi:peptidoglycan/xylan/chitin deacetylase (PgdA/CDA1 family)